MKLSDYGIWTRIGEWPGRCPLINGTGVQFSIWDVKGKSVYFNNQLRSYRMIHDNYYYRRWQIVEKIELVSYCEFCLNPKGRGFKASFYDKLVGQLFYKSHRGRKTYFHNGMECNRKYFFGILARFPFDEIVRKDIRKR